MTPITIFSCLLHLWLGSLFFHVFPVPINQWWSLAMHVTVIAGFAGSALIFAALLEGAIRARIAEKEGK